MHEAFLKDTQMNNNQEGAEKELKRSRKGAEKRCRKKQDILLRLAENPTITQSKLMVEFDLTRKQVQKVMKELQEDGLLKREGSNRSGKWIVK